MKIAQVTYSLGSGGAEKLATELSISLKKMGHQIDYIVIDKYTQREYEQAMIDRLRKAGIQVYSLKRRPGSGYAVVGPVARLLKRIIQQRYNIIHSHLPLSHTFIGLARLVSPVRFRHILTVHSTMEEWSKLTSILARDATVVFCSKAAADTFHYKGKKNIILNGINLSAYLSPKGNIAQLRATLGIPPDATMLISVGGILKGKNYSTALEVVSILQNSKPEADFHYAICGTGPEESAVRQKTKRLSLKDRVHLLGSRSDIPNLLNTADCFMSTSLYEGLPLSVLEAFSSGTKCALSPIKEHRDISEGIPGCVLATDETPQAMARAVLDVLEQPQLRKELKELRNPYLKQFSFETCAKSYEDLYKKSWNWQGCAAVLDGKE